MRGLRCLLPLAPGAEGAASMVGRLHAHPGAVVRCLCSHLTHRWQAAARDQPCRPAHGARLHALGRPACVCWPPPRGVQGFPGLHWLRPPLKPLPPTAFPSRVVQPHFSQLVNWTIREVRCPELASDPRTWTYASLGGQAGGVVTELEVGTASLGGQAGGVVTELDVGTASLGGRAGGVVTELDVGTASLGGQAGRVVTELDVGTQALPRPSGQAAAEGRAGSCRPAQPRRVQVLLCSRAGLRVRAEPTAPLTNGPHAAKR